MHLQRITLIGAYGYYQYFFCLYSIDYNTG